MKAAVCVCEHLVCNNNNTIQIDTVYVCLCLCACEHRVEVEAAGGEEERAWQPPGNLCVFVR